MIEQGSDAWFAQRAAVSITGSMVGAVLGISPFDNREGALRAKVREKLGAPSEFTGNIATSWGSKHEAVARAAYEEQTGHLVFDAEFVTHSQFNWIGASPDGLIAKDGLVEFKCPFSKTVKPLSESPHYYAQIQLQLHCTKRTWCDFVVWTPDEMRVERVEIDQEWLATYLPELTSFHEEVLAICNDENAAAPYLEDLEVVRDDSEWKDMAASWRELSLQEDEIKKKKEKLKQQLIESTAGKKSKGFGITVFPTQRAGTISYAKALKQLDIDVDFEPFRSQPITTWTVKLNEGAKA